MTPVAPTGTVRNMRHTGPMSARFEQDNSRHAAAPGAATGRRRYATATALVAALAGAGAGVANAAPTPTHSTPTHSTPAHAVRADATAPAIPRIVQYADPAASARGVGERGALGEHRVLVQPVYWTGSEPGALDTTAVAEAIGSANTYYRTSTNSAMSVTLAQTRPWEQITITAEEAASCDTEAIERETRKVAPDTPGVRSHLDIVFPETSACKFGALFSRGLTEAGDGVAFFNGQQQVAWNLIAYGIGSNSGLGMANSISCWTDAAHTTPVPLSDYCKAEPGGDPWDLMGWWHYGKVGKISAANLRRIGVLSHADFPEVTPGSGQYTFIRPLSAYQGQRGFAITVGDTRYTVEYRTPTDLDSWIDDATWTDPTGVVRTDPGGGVIVRMQDLASEAPADTTVLDFHPDGKDVPTDRHPGLEPGEKWTSPDEVVRLEVVSATAKGASIKVDFPSLDKVERWSGADRYAASAAMSAKSFDPGVGVAYIASGEVYPDALSGAPVAGNDRGPVLLVEDDRIPGAIQAELRRLTPGRIVILGGPATVGTAVADKLEDYTSGGVSRLFGEDRFATSAAISRDAFDPGVPTVYIASGRIYTDALSGAPVAGKTATPVLLVDTDAIPASIAAELTRLKPGRIVVMGGTSTITAKVETELRRYTSGAVLRYSGADRFDTSAAIAHENYNPGLAVVYVASGRVFPDALSGAPIAGMTRGPVLLVDTDTVPPAIDVELERLKPRRIVVLGGPATVSERVRAVLGSYLP